MPKPSKTPKNKTPKKTQDFDPAAMRAMMERMLGAMNSSQSNPVQRAQDLVYDAMDAATPAQRTRLAQQALELDPENVDALLMVAGTVGPEGEDRIAALRGIVAIGARQLGEKAFQELASHFWGAFETRPYMRARQQLALALQEAGRLEEAAVEYAAMLELNPNDNQGIRYQLLPVLLARGRLDEARDLMKRYPGECDWNVVFAWGRVLERALSGEDAEAVKALAVARKQNGHMEAYLKGRLKAPKNAPGSYSPGSLEEALCFAEALLVAWKAHPEARAWLLQQ